ncbi:MAG: signal peptide peptidase SppA, partial [Muribaculaceae bacterium]|nr:signal peptide peptidase SppA [Muribaculaceae bacterium]
NIISMIYGLEENLSGLNDILSAIRMAKNDSKIKGIYIECNGSSAEIATRQAIVEALNDFKKSGKWIVAYGDSYTQGDYLIASTADSLYLNPIGEIDIHGLGGSTLFFTGLLEKLGVEMQILRVGTYKSAVEPFILKEMSPASRKQQEEYVNALWNEVAKMIANNRNLAINDINLWADSLIMTYDTQYFVDNKIVDHLIYKHELDDKVAQLCDIADPDDIRYIDVNDYIMTVNANDPAKWADFISDSKKLIAVLYAVGDIVDSGNEGIVGDKMVAQIMELIDNDNVEGLILRVNSGGGSAFASEQIWEALEQFKATGRPFYASMGDVAASGGYYISCGADKIYAQPTTLTGSIGIFGIIPNIKKLLNNHLGITSESVTSSPNGTFPNIMEPMTPLQTAQMQKMINRGYETFVGRCAVGRDMPVDSIKAIAEGRVWAGVTAHEIGLVDELGSLQKAIADMAAKLELKGFTVEEYPSVNKKWWEELMELDGAIRMRYVQKSLGDAYPVYEAIERVKNMNRVQCRMESVVIE